MRDDREVRVPDPALPDDVTFSLLDRDVRGRLRTLSKDNADRVGRHLVMVGRLLDEDPEAAYEHAQAAVRRAGRVDVVREAAGLAAYVTGRYAEALRELRTVRRLNGSSEHLAVMADAERGLGRPERAITLSQEPEAATLGPDAQVELAIVVSGARLDLGQPEAAVAALSGDAVRSAKGLVAARVAQARAAALAAAGRPDDAAAELAAYPQEVLDEAAGNLPVVDDVVVYDLTEDDEADGTTADAPDEAADARTVVSADEVSVGEVSDGDVSDGDVSDDEASDGDVSDDEASDDEQSDDDVTPGGGTEPGAQDEGAR
ncbi:hypothetical protein [Cellulomonas wangsupingiae]|uniref:Replicase polyprotein 1ab n=1 Tax=Cellulomonas wangsupingiae TaxID=2968085 RepID=A0ABY5KCI4_9CELL|nr:hypothetical protein [Cellulomonas wangsupingiae]MCC2332993.1 hypothetical protein [Cellulomonas wangsupingiae]UUI66711.1 hypothetical protein NP075_08450 [Cellulomonas wangsupingiae]